MFANVELAERIDAAEADLTRQGARAGADGDTIMAMPPLPFWLRGAVDVGASIDAMVFAGCGLDAFRAIATEANGLPAIALYRRSSDVATRYLPYALQVLALDGDRLRELTAFLDVRVFRTFDLPSELSFS